MVFSTRNLLMETAKGQIIHADATYKLNWQGLPVLVFGTIDRERKFVLSGIAVCSGETEDFQFVFDALAKFYAENEAAYEFK